VSVVVPFEGCKYGQFCPDFLPGQQAICRLANPPCGPQAGNFDRIINPMKNILKIFQKNFVVFAS